MLPLQSPLRVRLQFLAKRQHRSPLVRLQRQPKHRRHQLSGFWHRQHGFLRCDAHAVPIQHNHHEVFDFLT